MPSGDKEIGLANRNYTRLPPIGITHWPTHPEWLGSGDYQPPTITSSERGNKGQCLANLERGKTWMSSVVPETQQHWLSGLGIQSVAQITQIQWATVSDSLRSLRTNEWLWAICSGCSWYKWANYFFALLPTKNKWFAQKYLTKIVFFGTFFVSF